MIITVKHAAYAVSKRKPDHEKIQAAIDNYMVFGCYQTILPFV